MSAFALLKRGVRMAVDLAGGVDGAAATVDKSRSLTGSWRNLNQKDLPTLGDAQALDEAALADGHAPEILKAYARSLDFVAIALPVAHGASEALPMKVLELAHELGEVSSAVSTALIDGAVDGDDPEKIAAEIDDLIQRAVELRAMVVPAHANAVSGQAIPIKRVVN